MLVELVVRDLALIEEAALTVGPGLNALTGETGAGKSLFVGALELLLGHRPRGDAAGWVRRGAERARVEGRFSLPDGRVARRVRDWIGANLPELADDGDAGPGLELVVGRTVFPDGRTRAHVDHRPVTLKSLKALVPQLLEIHGQNEHQLLLEPVEQIRLVDAFGGLEPRARAYADARARWRELGERLETLERDRAERRERLEFLRFQAGELDGVDPRPGERAELAGERELLRSAAELGAELGALSREMSEADDALLDRLRAADRLVERWRATIERLAPVHEELAAALVHLEEAAAGLASFVDGVEVDPRRLEEVEERLADLERLERKHGVPADELPERRAALAAEVATLEHDEEGASSLAEDHARAREELAKAAGELSRARRRLGTKLSRAVEAVLVELGLANAKVSLAVEPRGESAAEPSAACDDEHRFGPHGSDDVELLLAANPGEPPRPLRHVASGGETARIMLALRTVLAGCDAGRTLVFDEIDSGVGGRLGPAVGQHLRALAEHHQVLCVTHLPAIAALAHEHLSVEKETRGKRTRTRVVRLEGDARVREVAAMIAGGAGEETARAEAKRLLGSA